MSRKIRLTPRAYIPGRLLDLFVLIKMFWSRMHNKRTHKESAIKSTYSDMTPVVATGPDNPPAISRMQKRTFGEETRMSIYWGRMSIYCGGGD